MFFIRKIKTTEFWVFFAYLSFFFSGICLHIVFKYFLRDSIGLTILLWIVLLTEFLFISAYYSLILKSRYVKPILLLANFLFIGYCYHVYRESNPAKFVYGTLAIECIFFIVVIIYDFYEKMQYSLSEPIYHNSSFWVSVAFLVFFSGNVLLFIYTNIYNNTAEMIKDHRFQNYYRIIYTFFAILKNLLLCVAVLVHVYLEKRPPKKIPVPVDLDLGLFKNRSANPVLQKS